VSLVAENFVYSYRQGIVEGKRISGVLYAGLSVQVYVSIAEVVADVWPLNQEINGFWENGKPSESLLWGPQTWRSKQRTATSRFIWEA
jgi:hypothetical protein